METGKLEARKAVKEEFSSFFKRPSLEALPDFLKQNLGEFPFCDFKEEWPATGDLCRHMLALGNSGGGLIVVGIAENPDKTFNAVGIQGPLRDKADIRKEIEKYLPTALKRVIEMVDFDYTSSTNPKELVGKKFQIIFVDDDPVHIPFMAARETTNLKMDVVYVRRGASTEPASYEELQDVINRRIETNRSTKGELDLQAHLDQLKLLFDQIPRSVRQGGIASSFAVAITAAVKIDESFYGKLVPNPDYPKEDYEHFVAHLIESKKRRIEFELDITGASRVSSDSEA